MMRFLDIVAAAVAFVSTVQCQTSDSARDSINAVPTACPGVSGPRNPFQVASGWSAVKVAGNLTAPRGIIRDTQSRLLVLESGRGISQHTISTNGCIQSSRLLISQNTLNHGIYLSPNGDTLYASSATTVWSWGYDAASGNIRGAANVLVTGMITSGHVTRTLAIPPNRSDLLLVSHGSNGNFDYPSISPSTARAIVKVFNLSAVPAGGYNYVRDGYVMGYGLRNEVALAFDGNNMVWGVENSGDSFTRTVNGVSTDIHIDNPAEELNYLGDPAQPNNRWYGYPTCFTVWQPNVITDRRFSVGDQFVVAPNNTFNDSSCVQSSTPPRLSFQAHSAPLDAKFDADSRNLYITFHGSWNRQPPTGYKLVVVPFARDGSGNYAPAAAANSNTGYQDIFYHQDVTQCASGRCARPVGLVFDTSGRMYMTSDATAEGEVFLVGRT